jgi:uncharacterized GH25 family protein
MPRTIFRWTVGMALLCAGALSAHDLWIEPSSFQPASGTRLAVRLRIGQLFLGDPFPRDPKLMVRFSVLGAGGESPIPGVPDTDPAGYLVTGPPGLYELVYTSNHASVQLDAAKFEQYLADEGLEKISALRATKGLSTVPAKEIFSRCAKSLVEVAGDPGSGYDRVLGLTLELIPEKNPYTLAPGQELPVRLMFHGAPLVGAKVAAVPKDQPKNQVAARTDAQGRVRLRLARPGVWMVKAVEMSPAPAGSGADWESVWASITFVLPAPAAGPHRPASPGAAGR